jgi:hypothetical protein
MDFGGISDLIDKFGGFWGKSLLVVLWMALMATGIHVILIYFAEPLFRFFEAHDFASLIHLSSNVWTDIIAVLVVIIFTLIVSVFSAFLVVWFLLRLIGALFNEIFKSRATPSSKTSPESDQTKHAHTAGFASPKIDGL